MGESVDLIQDETGESRGRGGVGDEGTVGDAVAEVGVGLELRGRREGGDEEGKRR